MAKKFLLAIAGVPVRGRRMCEGVCFCVHTKVSIDPKLLLQPHQSEL